MKALSVERRAGELLKEMQRTGERRGRGGRSMFRQGTLKEIGITRKQSSVWQALADVPKEAC